MPNTPHSSRRRSPSRSKSRSPSLIVVSALEMAASLGSSPGHQNGDRRPPGQGSPVQGLPVQGLAGCVGLAGAAGLLRMASSFCLSVGAMAPAGGAGAISAFLGGGGGADVSAGGAASESSGASSAGVAVVLVFFHQPSIVCSASSG